MKAFDFTILTKLLLLLNLGLEISASNILFFHLGATASHRTAIWPLATKLADSGHNVTYIFPITRRPGSHPLIEELKPSKIIKAVEEMVGEFDINYRLNGTVNEWLKGAFEKMSDLCEAFYESPEIHEWLARPGLHYDLVMIDGGFSQCAYPLVHRFQAKQIVFNPVTVPWQWDTFGVIPETSSIPEFMFSIKPDKLQTSLWSRTLNTLSMAVWRYAYYDDAVAKMETALRNKLNLTDMPSFAEIERGTSLAFHNSYFIEDYPMSLPPMFISYSGLLCTQKSIAERKPLPEKLKSFIDSSEGFVYVSFGSSVKASAMPENLRNQFMTAFAAFPKLKFLWRWTGPIPENTPDNVLLQSWFPQLDVLVMSPRRFMKWRLSQYTKTRKIDDIPEETDAEMEPNESDDYGERNGVQGQVRRLERRLRGVNIEERNVSQEQGQSEMINDSSPTPSTSGSNKDRRPIEKILRDPRGTEPATKLAHQMKAKRKSGQSCSRQNIVALMDLKFDPRDFQPPPNYSPRIPKAMLYRAIAPNGEWVPVCFSCKRMYHLHYYCPYFPKL